MQDGWTTQAVVGSGPSTEWPHLLEGKPGMQSHHWEEVGPALLNPCLSQA